MTTLGDVIRGLLAKAEKARDRGINEADTKALFVEPMLGALGWDVDDLDAVRREHRVYDGTLLDYALKIEDKPRLFLEAKPLSKSLDDKQFIAQTINYANNEGVVWCVLTNGLLYRVYKTNEPADMERKLLFEVDLQDATDQAGTEDVAKLISYLTRQSIESGRLDEWGEETFTDVRVKSALDGLLMNPPIRFINLILETLGSNAQLPRDRVKGSLNRMALGTPVWRPAQAPPSTGSNKEPIGQSQWTYEHHLGGKPQNIVDLFNRLDERVMALGPDVRRSFTKFYIKYSTRRSFLTVEIRKRKLFCYVSLGWDELPERDELLTRDVRNIGHYGMGDTEIALSEVSELDYALRLIEASYRKSRQ
jgi:predicted transport protein